MDTILVSAQLPCLYSYPPSLNSLLGLLSDDCVYLAGVGLSRCEYNVLRLARFWGVVIPSLQLFDMVLDL